MTNPYAAPHEAGGTEPTSESWPTRRQLFVMAVMGAAYGITYVFSHNWVVRTFQPVTEVAVILAPLCIVAGCLAWFCGHFRQLIIAIITLSWSSLWTLAILFVVLYGASYIDWHGFLLALLLLPAGLIIIGWPVMFITPRRRLQNRTGQPSGESK